MLLSDFTKGIEKLPKFGTFLPIWVHHSYLLALKTFSADSLVPCGKNESLFSMVGKCIWSPEPFLQN